MPRSEQRRLLYLQIEESAQVTLRLTSHMQSEWERIQDMSHEQIFTELSSTAFGTMDLDTIGTKFSLSQRRGIRHAIINFIYDMGKMLPYRVLVQTNPREAAENILRVSRFTDDIDIREIPLSFIIFLSELDYANVMGIELSELSGHHGATLFSVPDELKGRIVLINLGGINTGHTYSPNEIDVTVKHEKSHVIFSTFFKQFGLKSIDVKISGKSDADQQNREIHKCMIEAEMIRRWVAQYVRDEIIAYSTNFTNVNQEEFLMPDQLLNGINIKNILVSVRDMLNKITSIDSNQKRFIYQAFLQKYQDLLRQMREGQWIARRLIAEVGQERAAVLMQSTSLEKFRRLARYFGVRPNEVQELIKTDMISYAAGLLTSEFIVYQLNSDWGAVMAYYPQEALPALLNIIQFSPTNLKVEFSIKTIQYILEANGGVIPPELGVSTELIIQIVERMQRINSSPRFAGARLEGDNLIELINQNNNLESGSFF